MTGYSTGAGNRLTADGTYTYAYDNDGNTTGRTKTSNGEVTTFTWDFRNRLTEVLIKSSGGVTLQDDKFTYDIENRRIGKNTLSGGQSWTIYSGQNPLSDYNSSGSLQFQYLYGNAIDFLLGRADVNANAFWYLTDKLGSVRENVNGSGTVLDSITYDTYGNILSETAPSSGDRFKYTSREWDSEIGQYFYRARYYGPGIGRFESEDPSGFAAGDTDLYRYARNSPSSATDPTGLRDDSKLLKSVSATLLWDVTGSNFPAGPRDYEGFAFGKLAVWDDGHFVILVRYDTYNSGTGRCDERGESHLEDIYGIKPTSWWKWTLQKRDGVIDGNRNGNLETFEHKDKKGKPVYCHAAQWFFWGEMPNTWYANQMYLQIAPMGFPHEKMTVSFSIQLKPERPPFTDADVNLSISGRAFGIDMPSKPFPDNLEPIPLKRKRDGSGNIQGY